MHRPSVQLPPGGRCDEPLLPPGLAAEIAGPVSLLAVVALAAPAEIARRVGFVVAEPECFRKVFPISLKEEGNSEKKQPSASCVPASAASADPGSHASPLWFWLGQTPSYKERKLQTSTCQKRRRSCCARTRRNIIASSLACIRFASGFHPKHKHLITSEYQILMTQTYNDQKRVVSRPETGQLACEH